MLISNIYIMVYINIIYIYYIYYVFPFKQKRTHQDFCPCLFFWCQMIDPLGCTMLHMLPALRRENVDTKSTS